MSTEADGQTVALTMSPEAAERFWSALIYAANRIPSEARKASDDEMSHEDWLRWGASRLDHANRALAAWIRKTKTTEGDSMNSQLTWDVTYHNGETAKVQAAELRIDAHGGAGFWTNDALVANVGPGSYRSVVREQDSE